MRRNLIQFEASTFYFEITKSKTLFSKLIPLFWILWLLILFVLTDFVLLSNSMSSASRNTMGATGMNFGPDWLREKVDPSKVGGGSQPNANSLFGKGIYFHFEKFI